MSFFKQQLVKFFRFQAKPNPDDAIERDDLGDDIPPVEDKEFDKLLELEHRFEGSGYSYTEYGGASFTRKRTGRTTWEGCASIVMEGSPKKMMDLFWDVKTRYLWDPMYGTNRVVKRRADGTELVYVCARAPKFIQRRDFLQLRRRSDRLDEGICLAVFLHHVHKDFPPTKGLIRGKVAFSGLIARSLGDGTTRFSLVSYPDVGAPIPNWMVNIVAPVVTKVYCHILNEAAGNIVKDEGEVSQKVVVDKKAKKLEQEEKKKKKKEEARMMRIAKKGKHSKVDEEEAVVDSDESDSDESEEEESSEEESSEEEEEDSDEEEDEDEDEDSDEEDSDEEEDEDEDEDSSDEEVDGGSEEEN